MDYCLSNDDGAAGIWNGQPNLDLDGDGRLDAIGLDLDGDGMQDDALADFDGDGMADRAVLDLDNDGVRSTPTQRSCRLGGAKDRAKRYWGDRPDGVLKCQRLHRTAPHRGARRQASTSGWFRCATRRR
jgi:hypothetical protein